MKQLPKPFVVNIEHEDRISGNLVDECQIIVDKDGCSIFGPLDVPFEERIWVKIKHITLSEILYTTINADYYAEQYGIYLIGVNSRSEGIGIIRAAFAELKMHSSEIKIMDSV